MNTKEIIEHIKNWLSSYHSQSSTKGFVIGISGGIDSALTSTLVAETNIPLLCIEMPINQNKNQVSRGKNHILWLKENYNNVKSIECDLTGIFEQFKSISAEKNKNQLLALANTRSRLRMTTLYYYAQLNNALVVGTGNKVEDFGIGFYTKYGDGGVDLSPIADLMKSEVFQLAKALKINKEILVAPPTDGLWDNDQTDEDQIGATYDELEWAMQNNETNNLSKRQQEVIEIYNKFHTANKHKMMAIPVCNIPDNLKSK
ncbi:MAG: NAD(+) synthase [Flavobacteriales bacterium]